MMSHHVYLRWGGVWYRSGGGYGIDQTNDEPSCVSTGGGYGIGQTNDEQLQLA